MKNKPRGSYPLNWSDISEKVKGDADWKCARCGHSHDTEGGYMLTVHHLDGDKSNCEWWNIPPLCQRCHLRIQGKVDMPQFYMFEHSNWFKPYVAGYYAHILRLPENKEFVFANIDELLNLGNSKLQLEGKWKQTNQTRK